VVDRLAAVDVGDVQLDDIFSASMIAIDVKAAGLMMRPAPSSVASWIHSISWR
jgi:hypothetical protein